MSKKKKYKFIGDTRKMLNKAVKNWDDNNNRILRDNYATLRYNKLPALLSLYLARDVIAGEKRTPY